MRVSCLVVVIMVMVIGVVMLYCYTMNAVITAVSMPVSMESQGLEVEVFVLAGGVYQTSGIRCNIASQQSVATANAMKTCIQRARHVVFRHGIVKRPVKEIIEIIVTAIRP